MPPAGPSYPALANLLSGWFHQDFDVVGDTLDDVIDAFSATSSAAQRQSLLADIARFLEIGDERLDAEFRRIFNPDVESTEFATSTRAFLEAIAERLARADQH